MWGKRDHADSSCWMKEEGRKEETWNHRTLIAEITITLAHQGWYPSGVVLFSRVRDRFTVGKKEKRRKKTLGHPVTIDLNWNKVIGACLSCVRIVPGSVDHWTRKWSEIPSPQIPWFDRRRIIERKEWIAG